MALPDITDGLFGSFIAAAASPETGLYLFEKLGWDGIEAVRSELLHEGGNKLAVAAHKVQQALKVTGNEDIHRRGEGAVKAAAAVIGAGAQKIGEDVVLIRGADKAADGQTKLTGDEAGEDIAEVAGGDGEVQLCTGGQAALSDQIGVSGEIIHDLRDKAADVYRVCGGQAAVTDGLKNLLDAGLGIIKVAVDGADMDIASLLRHHLCFLDGTDAVTGIEHGNVDTGNVPETFKGSFAGIAAGSSEDSYLLRIAALFCRSLHEIGQQAEGNILESGGGAAEQLEHGHITGGDSRGNFRRGELAGIGTADEVKHFLRCEIRKKRGDYLGGHVIVIESDKPLPIELRKLFGGEGIKSAVRGKAVDDGLSGGHGGGSAAGADIFHRKVSFINNTGRG